MIMFKRKEGIKMVKIKKINRRFEKKKGKKKWLSNEVVSNTKRTQKKRLTKGNRKKNKKHVQKKLRISKKEAQISI